jgi:hypothetical protein
MTETTPTVEELHQLRTAAQSGSIDQITEVEDQITQRIGPQAVDAIVCRAYDIGLGQLIALRTLASVNGQVEGLIALEAAARTADQDRIVMASLDVDERLIALVIQAGAQEVLRTIGEAQAARIWRDTIRRGSSVEVPPRPIL